MVPVLWAASSGCIRRPMLLLSQGLLLIKCHVFLDLRTECTVEWDVSGVGCAQQMVEREEVRERE